VWWQTVISPDSKWIFFHSQDRDGKDSLFRAPLSGEKAERVGDFPSARFSGQLNMSLDGRQILATCFGRAPATNNGGSDLWMLENFVPSASKLQVRFMVHPTHEAP
jgi:Tol biopolymer transport system component